MINLLSSIACFFVGHKYRPCCEGREIPTTVINGDRKKHKLIRFKTIYTKEFKYTCSCCFKETKWIPEHEIDQWLLEHKPSWNN